jgi:succinyl-CoA synthetase beta subunit
MVIRLDGTNAEEGRAILSSVESDRVVSQPTMLDAARKAVELAARESATEAATAPAGREGRAAR